MNMNLVILIFTTILMHMIYCEYRNTICENNMVCNCNNFSITCYKLSLQLPINIPNNITTIHFTEVYISHTINNQILKDDKLVNLTWSMSNITTVGPLNKSELIYLDLSYNLINNISSSFFVNIPRLQYLDLSNNHISSLSDNTFSSLNLIENINLENNLFQTLSQDIFKESVGLRYLSLGNFNLLTIPNGIFSNLENLEYLNIGNSGIQYIQSSIGDLNNLKILNINNCINLTTIEEDFIDKKIPNIEVINMSNCSNIQNLPMGIASLKNLRELYMHGIQVPVNCYNGWFTKWYKETTVIKGYKNFSKLSAIDNLDCPPKIYYISGSVTLKLTKNGKIVCKSFGHPKPAITWLIPGGLTYHENKENDRNISSHPKIHDWDMVSVNNNQQIFTDSDGYLNISRMIRNNIGNYTCYVSNIYGHDSQVIEVHLESEFFFNIKINALLLGILSAMGFLMLTILCCALKLLLKRLNCIKVKQNSMEMQNEDKQNNVPENV
ncbi:leucine-rich repeat and immunoglobulin-like domain-containing nogo receptor-interacting protein 2 [Daktulosphaira vitifoliae]|uniref:leucine-rich repeat and immunoglobulin-like domain-containing nogo receptor-interacting protein 2 n=1 Tax=Daktulosphaira vitifoliae TaxID=58002 RepID=UPI0021AA0B51|nr:leucine-rich repeat and immunoglobulin-like domain-containing nogo receptor-interacting protein 2 [Daktulosphaira vitifoliae]